jgi:hypothetical protein
MRGDPHFVRHGSRVGGAGGVNVCMDGAIGAYELDG